MSINISPLDECNKEVQEETIVLINKLQKDEFKQFSEVAMDHIHGKITLSEALASSKLSSIKQDQSINRCFRVICSMIICFAKNTEDNYKTTMADLGFCANLINSSYLLFKSNNLQESMANVKMPEAFQHSPETKYLIDLSTFSQQTTKNPQRVLIDIKLSDSGLQKLEMNMNTYHQFRYEISQLLYLFERARKSETFKS